MKGKTALVTGGTNGIGKGIVMQLLADGFNVSTFARHKQACAELQAQVTEQYGNERTRVFIGDVTKDKICKNIVDKTIAIFSRLDILINNAGTGYFSPCDEVDLSAFNEMMQINMIGVARMTKLVAPQMKKQGAGLIINIVSMSGKRAITNGSFYAATKFAARGYSDGIRKELKKFGIKVCTICPGMVNTRFLTKQELSKRKKQNYDKMPAMLAVDDISRVSSMICAQSDQCDIQDINILPFYPL